MTAALDATPGEADPRRTPGVARLTRKTKLPESDRFWMKVDGAGFDTCWLWTSVLGQKGYARFRGRKTGQYVAAHRWAYEQMVGEIPEGLELDHLCRNRKCVNPYHLDPVTHAENCRRTVAAGFRNRLGHKKAA